MFAGKTALLIRSSSYCKPSFLRLHQDAKQPYANVAVVLSGCGAFDGTELHEASAVLVHLSRNLAITTMFAPNIDQMHVVNHATGKLMEEKRNVLVESARIARGPVNLLSSLKARDFDAVIFPGGFGAAKNLSNFAFDAKAMTVLPDVERILKEFHTTSKPIGLCCIAPVLAAKVFQGCELTVGYDQEEGGKWPYAGTAAAITSMGSIHVNRDVHQTHVDRKNRIVTTPAFMGDAPLHRIFDGIGEMVREVLQMAPPRKS